MSERTWTEHRIETRRPGRAWSHVPFSGSTNRDLERLQRTLQRARQESPTGWEHKITSRQVTITATEWS